MKKLISLLVVVAMMAACLGTAVFAAEDAVITVGSADAVRGEEVTLEVSIAGNPGFAATKVTIEYDATVLELVSLNTEDMLLEGGAVNKEKGIVSFAKATNVTEDGVLLTVTFLVKEDGGCGGFEVKAVLEHLTAEDRSSVAYTTVAGTVGTAHSFGEWEVVEAANCTVTGLEQRVCAYCGETETREIGTNGEHKVGEGWQCDEIAHWHVCEHNEEHQVDYSVHTYGEGVEAENGWTVYTCTVCGYEKSEEPAPTGDMSVIFFALTAVSGTGLVTLVAKKKED